jgi:hypothetical protein
LDPGSISANLSNAVRKRKYDLPPGVEFTNLSRNRVVGVLRVCVKGKSERKRSPQTWSVEEKDKAHAWYLAEREKYYGKRLWANNDPPEQTKLIFPPLKKLVVPVSFSGFERGRTIEGPIPF